VKNSEISLPIPPFTVNLEAERIPEKRASLQISDHLSLFWGCLSRYTLQCICTETHRKCFEICSIVQDPQDVSRIFIINSIEQLATMKLLNIVILATAFAIVGSSGRWSFVCICTSIWMMCRLTLFVTFFDPLLLAPAHSSYKIP
jgi:hypothetical protein